MSPAAAMSGAEPEAGCGSGGEGGADGLCGAAELPHPARASAASTRTVDDERTAGG